MYLWIPLILLPSSVLAWDWFSPPPPPKKVEVVVVPHSGPPPICLSNEQRVKQNRYTCPEVKELYRKDMRWQTDSGWKGYQKSFSDDLSYFMGAQWKGVGVGNIYCIYQPSDPTEFPIQLTLSQLIERPETARWDDADHLDVLNCISKNGNPCECQFSHYIQEEEQDLENIIYSIEKVY